VGEYQFPLNRDVEISVYLSGHIELAHLIETKTIFINVLNVYSMCLSTWFVFYVVHRLLMKRKKKKKKVKLWLQSWWVWHVTIVIPCSNYIEILVETYRLCVSDLYKELIKGLCLIWKSWLSGVWYASRE
jgi:hypothetical protein